MTSCEFPRREVTLKVVRNKHPFTNLSNLTQADFPEPIGVFRGAEQDSCYALSPRPAPSAARRTCKRRSMIPNCGP